MEYEVVIGLEVHAQLKTDSKLFCADSTSFGNPPNTNVSPVSLGMPGVLPVLNQKAVELAIRAGLATNCEIREHSVFARKHYFYPDLPKGYQVSQFDKPVCENGFIDVETEKLGKRRIGITRIHLEEDAGKSTHVQERDDSILDYNRAGVPLIEIVSEPDIRSTDETVQYLKKLRQILRYLDVCDGNMQEGSLRCDANISLRPVGTETLGTRTELKNINSFKFVQKGLEYEIARHREMLLAGEQVIQETRLFDTNSQCTYSMRGKEESHDYRYFPEPDLMPLVIEPATISEVKSTLPELPDAKKARFISELHIPEYDAEVLTAEHDVALFFEEVISYKADAKKASNWVMTEVIRIAKESDKSLSNLNFTAKDLADLILTVESGKISVTIAKSVFTEMVESGKTPEEIIAANPAYQLMDDTDEIAGIVGKVISNNPDIVEKIKAGQKKVMGALVGQVMKATKGKADPKIVNRLISEKLG